MFTFVPRPEFLTYHGGSLRKVQLSVGTGLETQAKFKVMVSEPRLKRGRLEMPPPWVGEGVAWISSVTGFGVAKNSGLLEQERDELEFPFCQLHALSLLPSDRISLSLYFPNEANR